MTTRTSQEANLLITDTCSATQFDMPIPETLEASAVSNHCPETALDSWKRNVDRRFSEMDKRHRDLEAENALLKDKLLHLQHQVNEMEHDLRSNNLIFNGLDIEAGEAMVDCVKRFLEQTLKLPNARNVMIDAAFEMEDLILAKFTFMSDRNRVLAAAKAGPANATWHVKPDTCRAWHETRKKLAPIFKKWKDDGCDVKVRKDFLVKDGVRYDYDPELDDVVPVAQSNGRATIV